MVMNGKCQNCGELIEDSLTHCSTVCRFEDYLKSQSIIQTPKEKEEFGPV